MLISQHLDFDVRGAFHVALEVESTGPEGAGCQCPLLVYHRLQLLQGLDDLYTNSPASAGGLHHEGKAQGPSHVGGVSIVYGLAGTGHHGHARPLRHLAGLQLVAHIFDDLGRRSHEPDSGILAALGEGSAFRKEAVAGMYRLCTRLESDLNDLVLLQIAVPGRGSSQQVGFVGHLDVLPFGISFRVHSHGLDAHLFTSADYPAGDFAPVSNQQLLEHVLALTLPRTKIRTMCRYTTRRFF